MDKQNTNDEVKSSPETAPETPADVKEVQPAEPDAKALARQRSKDDLARTRRNMRQNRGKR